MAHKHPPKKLDQRIARAIVEEATERAVTDDNGCLIWPDKFCTGGYGVTAWGGHRAHRLAFTAAHHDPGPLMVRHLCGNRSCFNADHLAEGTAADNMADTIAMGRHSNQHKAPLMTPDKVAVAIGLIDDGYSISVVAEMMNVGYGTIQRATAGKVDPTITGGRHARKVVDGDVLRARRDVASGTATIREVADRLGISWPAAQKMIQGRTYRHVGEAVPEASGRREHTPEPCVVDGCDKSAIARGHCTMHYDRLMTHGTPGPAQPHRSKLDEAKVRTIRQMRREGAKVQTIAEAVGAGHSTVESVLAGRTWAHVT